MKFKKLSGRETNVNISKYSIDWKDDSLSKFQWNVKQFLYPHWRAHIVLEEFRLPGCQLRLDFFNITRWIGIECDGGQHTDPKHYYNKGSAAKYLAQVKRDAEKDKWCEANNILLIRIGESDVADLSNDWIYEKYNIKL